MPTELPLEYVLIIASALFAYWTWQKGNQEVSKNTEEHLKISLLISEHQKQIAESLSHLKGVITPFYHSQQTTLNQIQSDVEKIKERLISEQ